MNDQLLHVVQQTQLKEAFDTQWLKAAKVYALQLRRPIHSEAFES